MVTTFFCNQLIVSLLQGVWSRWVINYEVANGDAGIMSKKQGLVHLPVSGWLYWDGSTGQDDDTLTVIGK